MAKTVNEAFSIFTFFNANTTNEISRFQVVLPQASDVPVELLRLSASSKHNRYAAVLDGA
jgi:hypothetical protein